MGKTASPVIDMRETETETPKPAYTLIDRRALAVARLAATHDDRPALAHVQIKDGRAWATDGFALGVAELPPAADAPVGAKALAEGEPVLIGRTVALEAARATSEVWVDGEPGSRGVRWVRDGIDMGHRPQADHPWPNCEKILHNAVLKADRATVVLSVDLLERILKTARKFQGPGHAGAIELAVGGPRDAVLVITGSEDALGGRMLAMAVMPMVLRTDGGAACSPMLERLRAKAEAYADAINEAGPCRRTKETN